MTRLCPICKKTFEHNNRLRVYCLRHTEAEKDNFRHCTVGKRRSPDQYPEWVREKRVQAVTPMQMQHMTAEKFVQFSNGILNGNIVLGRLGNAGT